MYLTPMYLLFCGSAFPPSRGKLSVEGKWDYICAKLCIKKKTRTCAQKEIAFAFVEDIDFLFLIIH